MHGSPGNSSDRARRAVTVNYASDGVIYEPRPFNGDRQRNIASHVSFPKLEAGGSIECDLFPRVWP